MELLGHAADEFEPLPTLPADPCEELVVQVALTLAPPQLMYQPPLTLIVWPVM